MNSDYPPSSNSPPSSSGDTGFGGRDTPSMDPYQRPNLGPMYGQRSPIYGSPQTPVYNPQPPMYGQNVAPPYGQAPPGGYPYNPQGPPGGWQQPHAGRPMYQQQESLGLDTLAPVDRKIIRECNRESFFFRCLPLGLASCTAFYYYNVKNAKPHSIPKYLMLVVGSWIAGKISYREVYIDRLVQSNSTSPFVQRLRRSRGMAFQPDDNAPTGSSEFVWDETPASGTMTPPGDSIYGGSPQQTMSDSPHTNAPMTHDQLRAQNRGRAM